MKKFFICFLLGLFLALPIFAAGPDIGQNAGGMIGGAATKAGYAAADEYSLSRSVGGIIRGALGLVGTIFLALTVYAGYLWMTARGEESKVEEATKIIKASVIGLIITLAGYSLSFFVVDAIMRAT